MRQPGTTKVCVFASLHYFGRTNKNGWGGELEEVLNKLKEAQDKATDSSCCRDEAPDTQKNERSVSYTGEQLERNALSPSMMARNKERKGAPSGAFAGRQHGGWLAERDSGCAR